MDLDGARTAAGAAAATPTLAGGHDGPAEEAPERAYARFRQALLEARLLVATGVDGLYLRSGDFEGLVAGIDRLVSEAAAGEVAGRLHCPPVVPRVLLERTAYLRSFPDLAGAVTSFGGGEPAFPALLAALDAGAEWSGQLEATDLALCSAGCHPLYPTLSGVLEGERRVEVFAQIFRHEPSIDPARMQSFRQHEVVYVGGAEGAEAHRDRWVERAVALLSALGLAVEPVVANDPFFGRAGAIMAAGQRDDALKVELVATVASAARPTAIASANCHRDHFGVAFGISLPGGAPAHSACFGFGVERVALALLAAHGLDLDRWPVSVRERLGL